MTRRIYKEIAGGAFIAVGIIAMVYFVFNLYFHELFLQYKLTLANAYLQTRQIMDNTDYQLESMLIKEQVQGQGVLSEIRVRWAKRLNIAKKSGLKEFITTYFSFVREYNEAKDLYDKKIWKAERQAKQIREATRKEIKELIRKTKNNANPIFLLLFGKAKKEAVKGYLYDPNKGEISPVSNSLRIKDEKK